MTQPTQSLLGEDAYRNPRHEQEAAEFQASHAQASPDAQGETPTANSEPVHNWEKRYKDLQSWSSKEMNKMKSDVSKLKQELASQNTPVLTAPKTPEELEAFKAQNAEMYGVIQTMAHDIAKAHIEQTDQRVAAMTQDLQATKQGRAKEAIKAKHPNFLEMINSQQFQEWAARQPSEVQDWVFNNPDDPDKAIRALDLFKYDAGLSQQTHSSTHTDLAVSSQGASADTNGLDNPQRIWLASEIRQISPRDYPKYAETIDIANREGRVDHSR
jgi:hypothetical protein